ncbi:MAG: hypothetical protein ACR2OU_02465, partial [Thermomicrobiales bacterium]
MTDLAQTSRRSAPRVISRPASEPLSVRLRRPGQIRRLITYLFLIVVCAAWIYPLLWMISA